MLTQHEIDGMRDTSASAQPDTCTITRPSDDPPTLDVVTGVSTPAPAETIYTGPCRVRPREAQEQNVSVGDLHETLSPYVGTLPATAALAASYARTGVTVQGDPNDVRTDDYLVVTASTDPSMVDRAFQVRHTGRSSWQIDRRIGLEDREQPQGIEVGS